MFDSVLILSIDTASLAGSVCLSRGGVVVASAVGAPEVSHSNSLLRDINECLEEAGVSLDDVDLFAAAAGPGSFTGLRIGLATLKALAATLAKPCVGVPTLEALARAAGPSDATVALMPAGRGEVFAQMFSIASDDAITPLDEASHLSPQNLIAKYGSLKHLRWGGEGAHKNRNLLTETATEKGIQFGELIWGEASQGWTLAPEEKNLSKHVAALALRQFRRSQTIDARTLKAIYVRPSDAELKCL